MFFPTGLWINTFASAQTLYLDKPDIVAQSSSWKVFLFVIYFTFFLSFYVSLWTKWTNTLKKVKLKKRQICEVCYLNALYIRRTTYYLVCISKCWTLIALSNVYTSDRIRVSFFLDDPSNHVWMVTCRFGYE